MTDDPRLCPHCRLQLAGRTHYREVTRCWVERRRQGGANAARAAIYSGRAVCAVCIADVVGPNEGTEPPKATTCDRCEEDAERLFMEVTHCWVIVRGKGARAHAGANAITRAHYSGLVLCLRCCFEAEQGEQLELFS